MAISYKNKQIAIVGFGLEGQTTYEYLKKQHPRSVVVFDEDASVEHKLPPEVQFVHGIDADFSGYDAVFRTPAIAPGKLSSARHLTSATIEFFESCPAQIVAVTGTKGKGTTASLIAEILKSTDNKVHLLGNIGKPALSELSKIMPDDIIVYEISSFQLWDMEISPHVAVVLRVGTDHLDVHTDREDYVNAKANIAKHQTESDVIVYMKPNETSRQIAEQSPAKHVPYFAEGEGARVEGDAIFMDGVEIMKTSEVGLVGGHNLENVCAAVAAAWQYTQDVDAIKKAVSSFKGLEHRLEFVREVEGVKYYNDSFATTPESAMAAAKAFDKPVTIILGGSNKGSDFRELAKTLTQVNLNKAILIGEQAGKLKDALNNAGVEKYVKLDSKDINEIVEVASSAATQGGVVVLSPACASFDMFESYKERGAKFKLAVQRL